MLKGLVTGAFLGLLIGGTGVLVASLAGETPAGNTPPRTPQVAAPEAVATLDDSAAPAPRPGSAASDSRSDPASAPLVVAPLAEPSAPVADTEPLDLPVTAAVDGALAAPDPVALPDMTADAVSPVLPNPQSRAPQVPVAEEDVIVSTEPAAPVVVELPEPVAAETPEATPDPAPVVVEVVEAPAATPAPDTPEDETPAAELAPPVETAETVDDTAPEPVTADPVTAEVAAAPAAPTATAPEAPVETAEAAAPAAQPISPAPAEASPAAPPSDAATPEAAPPVDVAAEAAEVAAVSDPVSLVPSAPVPAPAAALPEPENAPAPAPVETAEAVTPPAPAPAQPTPEVVAGTEAPAPDPVTPEGQAAPAPAVVSILNRDSGRRLPGQAGGTLVDRAAAPEPAAPTPVVVEEQPEIDAPAIRRHAAVWQGDRDGPMISVILIDALELSDPVGALTALPFDVTVALDPTAPGAASRMTVLRAAGIEVAILLTLPEGATPSDVEISLAAARDVLPATVLLLDDGSRRHARGVTDQIIAALAEEGRGFVTAAQGLDTGLRLAEATGVPAAAVLRDLGNVAQEARALRRFLDQAAFRARQTGGEVLMGRITAETLTALAAWGVSLSGDTVRVVPASALLTRDGG